MESFITNSTNTITSTTIPIWPITPKIEPVENMPKCYTENETIYISSGNESDCLESSAKNITTIEKPSSSNDKVDEAPLGLRKRPRRLCGSVKKKFRRMLAQGIPYEQAKEIMDQQWEEINALKLSNLMPDPNNIKQTNTIPIREEFKSQRKNETIDGGFKVGIVPRQYPEWFLTEEQAKKVQSAVLNALDRAPLGQHIKFNGSSRKPGWLSITCADKFTHDWLKNTVDMLRPYEGAQLKMIEGRDIPKQVIYSGFFPDDENIHEDKILSRLGKQNNELHTQNWKVLKKTILKKGQYLVVSVDEISDRSLQKLDHRPFFGLDRVTFRISEEKEKLHTPIQNSSSYEPKQSTSRSRRNRNRKSDDRRSERSSRNNYDNRRRDRTPRRKRSVSPLKRRKRSVSPLKRENDNECIIFDNRRRRYDYSPPIRVKDEGRRYSSTRY